MSRNAAGILLGSINLNRSHPPQLYLQLYHSLRELILNSTLQSEQRLPSSRVLAEELGISRTTVLTVYDRLTTEELIYSKTGAGSFVSKILNQRPQTFNDAVTRKNTVKRKPLRLSKSFRKMQKRLPVPVELSNPQPFSTAIPAIDVFPMDQWGKLVSKISRRRDLVGYNSSKGYPLLRRAIAAHLRTERGLECRPEQIYVTSGAQQAFNFLAEILLNPGDTVWFENPGSRIAQKSFKARSVRLVPVPVDKFGLQVEKARVLSPDFALVSVTPSHQQPRGSTMSLTRRIELLNAADQADAWIIEDDFDSEFFYARQPLPALFSVAANQRVIYVGTFSKSMYPSLRLGYFVVPDTLIDCLNKSVCNYLPGVPLLLQAAAAEFIELGHFATHIRKAKKVYLERYRMLETSINRYLHDYLDLLPTETGFHALAIFKKDFDERKVEEFSMRQNLLVRPLSNYCISPLDNTKGIVLGYGCINPSEIERSVLKLRDVFISLDKGGIA